MATAFAGLALGCAPAGGPPGAPGPEQAQERMAELAEARAERDQALDQVAELARRLGEVESRAALAEQRPKELAEELAEELERMRVQLAEAEALASELRRAADEAETRRIEREREWLRFTRALSKLELEALEALPEGARFQVDAELASAEPEAADDEPAESTGAVETSAVDAHLARSAELGRDLRALFRIDGLRGMDLFETGLLGEGCIGPVVFRLVDADGRLSGSLVAERLRLEASRAARTVTLVLEEGSETWRGARTEFEPAGPDPRGPRVRRVVLPRVDPDPWLEALPELFAETELGLAPDDGLWSASLVRGTLNELLRQDAAGGYFRLRELAGVRDEVLRGVHLEGYDADGRLERHLFADRMRVERQERGVLLQLEDGAQLRGDDKAAFLDGRFRIFLPRADPHEWAARGIPGMAEPAPPGVGSAGAVDAEGPAGG